MTDLAQGRTGQQQERPRSADQELRARAKAVIPGGMYGHQNAGPLPPEYPQFMRSGRGARIWDVDGNEYVDLMNSYGPVVLGHRHPAVEAAVAEQAEQADCQNGPGPVMVELAELLVATVDHADWAMLAKNGTDATTACCTIARAQTGRGTILAAKGAYHGSAPWCTPRPAGVTPADRANLAHYTFNDLASVREAAARAGDDLAAILVSPFRHDAGFDQELVDPAFARGLREVCDAAGAALILDDVRCGFRLALGSSWEPVGVRPDLSAWSKAIANGYALAAVTGNDRFREAATKVFITGSFWCGTVAMAAARTTLRIARETDVPGHLRAMGLRLREGLASLANANGIAIRQSGPPQMPLMLFDGDPDVKKGRAFCSAALRHGAFFHPVHNMFLSSAHQPADIDAALEAASHGFKAVRALS